VGTSRLIAIYCALYAPFARDDGGVIVSGAPLAP
jgi:hypothetical protein